MHHISNSPSYLALIAGHISKLPFALHDATPTIKVIFERRSSTQGSLYGDTYLKTETKNVLKLMMAKKLVLKSRLEMCQIFSWRLYYLSAEVQARVHH